MPDTLELNVALAGFRRAVADGRVAHAWLLVGSPRGAAAALAEAMLRLLFCRAPEPPCGVCPDCRQVSGHTHADTLWVEPESKSRQVTIDLVRDTLLPRMTQTSYAGGWKACVIRYADRMNEAAQNALLKTLEEPPPKTLLLLLTDEPQALLPTIASRCQKLRIGGASPGLTDEQRTRILDVLSGPPALRPLERLARAVALAGLLKEIRDELEASLPPEEEDETQQGKDVLEARIRAVVRERQTEALHLLSDWRRAGMALTLDSEWKGGFEPDRMEALRREVARLDPAAAFQQMDCVETLNRRLERNLPAEWAFESYFQELEEARSGNSGRSEGG